MSTFGDEKEEYESHGRPICY